ncbi:MAG: M4 family metallopeptidase [Gelidibacter sp.]|nr:M4 family metallopeptidase [Gelidibacter sp.]
MIAFLFINFFVNAQEAQKTIAKLKADSNAIITIDKNSGLAEFVRFPVGNAMSLNGNTLQEKVNSFLQTYKSIFNIESVDESLFFKTIKTDNYGLEHVILEQKYKDVPVFDGELRFHFNIQKQLTAINGNYISGIKKINQVPTLSKQQAEAYALNFISKQDINHSKAPLKINKNTLYVFAKGLIQGQIVSHHLVYEVEVRNDLDVREFVFIDAHTGALVEQFTGIAHAIDRKVYENNTGNLVWQEGNALPGALTIWQRNEVIASGHVYDFFKNAFGFISYDGVDGTMRTINNNPNISCPNASWNGFSANYCDGTASDDVIAHEWGHAYTEYNSGLIYAFQSGAINESYSDIWGETIDILNNYEDSGENLAIRTNANCNSTRWKIGEDASAFGGAIRDMWNPVCNGDPGKVSDTQYACGNGDSGGVHTNSGVPNHAYALLVDGGSYNSLIVNSIGFVKAAHIFWRAQNVYLTSTSDFANLADALEAACADLVGVNLQGLSTTNSPAGPSGQIITVSDCQSVSTAITAVELRIDPVACGYTPILGPTPRLCDAATSNPLFYEDWENGLGAWTVSQLPTNAATWTPRDWTLNSSLPDNRTGTAMFGIDPINGNCTSDLQNGIIRLQSRVINIPNINTGSFTMVFSHYVETEKLWDGGNIKYSLNGGPWLLLPNSAFTSNGYNSPLNSTIQGNDNPMQGQASFTGTDGGSLTGSWGKSVVDLSSIGVTANSTLQLRWELGTDGCNGARGWFLDDIVIFNCSATLSVSESDYLDQGIRVFPNPSNGQFTLKKIRNIDLIKADIFDVNGRLVNQIDLTTMQTEIDIDISRLTSGIYFMSVTSQGAKSTIKLIKH